jgi:hypothetical protein
VARNFDLLKHAIPRVERSRKNAGNNLPERVSEFYGRQGLRKTAASPSLRKAEEMIEMADGIVPDQTGASRGGEKWSLWKSANIGLLGSAFMLLIQVGGGRGFELASYAHTASAETISNLIGKILAAPMIFVLIAVVRNLLYRRRPKSSTRAVRGGLTFAALLVCMFGALVVYGEVVFSSTETISGEPRKTLAADVARSCARSQRGLGQNVTEAQIDKYCTCVGEKMADSTTWQQLVGEPDAAALAALRQRAEAAGSACR